MGNKLVTYLIYGLILWWIMKRMGYDISSRARNPPAYDVDGFNP